MSYHDLDFFGVNTQAIHESIRQDFAKVLSGELNSYSVSNLFRFDYYYELIRELIDDPFEIEDFNGWEQDFHHQIQFDGKNFSFYGSVWINSYTLEREQ